MYKVQKVVDGFSTCFRQHGAEGTHCRFLHGYGVSVEFEWEGDLDFRNWVVDFGAFKRSSFNILGMSPKDYLNWLLDHTVIIAESDPYLEKFKELEKLEIIQLRTFPEVGCEMFAKYLFELFSDWTKKETNGRARLVKVTVREHEKNSASFGL